MSLFHENEKIEYILVSRFIEDVHFCCHSRLTRDFVFSCFNIKLNLVKTLFQFTSYFIY